MIEVTIERKSIAIRGLGGEDRTLHISDAKRLLIQLETAVRIYDDLEKEDKE